VQAVKQSKPGQGKPFKYYMTKGELEVELAKELDLVTINGTASVPIAGADDSLSRVENPNMSPLARSATGTTTKSIAPAGSGTTHQNSAIRDDETKDEEEDNSKQPAALPASCNVVDLTADDSPEKRASPSLDASALTTCQARLTGAKQELKDERTTLWQYLEQKTNLTDTAADYDETVKQLDTLIDSTMGNIADMAKDLKTLKEYETEMLASMKQSSHKRDSDEVVSSKACQARVTAVKQELKDEHTTIQQYFKKKKFLSETAAYSKKTVGQLNTLIDMTVESIQSVTNEIKTWKDLKTWKEEETAIMKQSSCKRKV
jgi:hypothetical protein